MIKKWREGKKKKQWMMLKEKLVNIGKCKISKSINIISQNVPPQNVRFFCGFISSEVKEMENKKSNEKGK